jgi:ribosomal protein L10
MSTDDRNHYNELIQTHKKRLRVLEKQAALYGKDCPPHIQIEIEEILESVSLLKEQIDSTHRPSKSEISEIKEALSIRRLRAFSSADKPAVRALYRQLKSDGIDAWLDEEDILPGQDWTWEIPEAVRTTDVVLVCLSKKSTNKAGYIQQELDYALKIADQQPKGVTYIVPARIEDCIVPVTLQRWQWVDLFKESGYIKLISALTRQAEVLNLNKPKLNTGYTFIVPASENTWKPDYTSDNNPASLPEILKNYSEKLNISGEQMDRARIPAAQTVEDLVNVLDDLIKTLRQSDKFVYPQEEVSWAVLQNHVSSAVEDFVKRGYKSALAIYYQWIITSNKPIETKRHSERRFKASEGIIKLSREIRASIAEFEKSKVESPTKETFHAAPILLTDNPSPNDATKEPIKIQIPSHKQQASVIQDTVSFELAQKFTASQLVLSTDYRGLTVADISNIRNKLRGIDSDLIVSRNTLSISAARMANYEINEALFTGPTALIFSYKDAKSTAQIINRFNSGPKKLLIRGGWFEKQIIPASALKNIANMPTRQEALKQITSTIILPVNNLYGATTLLINKIFEAQIKQLLKGITE